MEKQYIFATCPCCCSSFVGIVKHDFLGAHVVCPSCASSFDVDAHVSDKELENAISAEFERILGYEYVRNMPDSVITAVRNIVEDDSNYPDYNDDDVTIAVKNTILDSLTYYVES